MRVREDIEGREHQQVYQMFKKKKEREGRMEPKQRTNQQHKEIFDEKQIIVWLEKWMYRENSERRKRDETGNRGLGKNLFEEKETFQTFV